MDCVMAILGCQLDYFWNEVQSRNGELTCERFSAGFRVGETPCSLELWGMKKHL